MFELQKISKRYQHHSALDEIDLNIPEGKISILIGPSGCGKSTLLRLLIGLIQPSSGKVLFRGMDLNAADISCLRHQMGYVIQDGGLFPHLTAQQNVTLVADYLHWTPQQIHDRLHELTELTSFPEDGLQRYPHQLSGGQRQRVSLIRALMLNPDVLLLDEPLGALDPMIRSELQDELRTIFRKLNKTVVMVTHDLGEAFYFGDYIVLIRAGKIVQKGTFQDLYHHPADPYVTTFINAQRSPLDELNQPESTA
ncbi:MAG: ATP-binding cassette domain-containing protein [bacterium]|jgi:osmoprotectant transport system ATP-binding protein